MSRMFAIPVLAMVVAIAAMACTDGSSAPPLAGPTSQATAAPTQEAPAVPLASPEPTLESTAELVATPTSEPSAEPTPEPTIEAAPTFTPAPVTDLEDIPMYVSTYGWKTDFTKHSVSYDEISSGGPPRDGIRPIDEPKFIDVAQAPDYMKDNEPVISLEINGEARAYPLAILTAHEIVNDELGGVPVTVTYCPLCNTAIAFHRTVNGMILDFGTTGNLRNSDLVMWDRQTESWWQQITGEAIVGELTGEMLGFLPASIVSWQAFREAFPDGQLLSRDTGSTRRNYDSAPYRGYDENLDSRPFMFGGDIDPRLQPMERVVALSVDGRHVAYPFALLADHPVINDSIDGQDLVVFYTGGTVSPFGGSQSRLRQVVGSTSVFDPVVDGRKLTFLVEEDVIMDEETGSSWNILGQAVEGPLQGSQLTSVIHGNHFWFAWAAFNPDTEVVASDDVLSGIVRRGG